MKGIIFTEPLFLAVIEGRKTQTRRIVKPQPILKNGFYRLGGASWSDTIKSFHPMPCHSLYNKSRYKVGEKVYLKEPYRDTSAPEGHFAKIDYLYDKNGIAKEISGGFKWKNKLFMPEKYARYFIEITEVRCERLHEISDDDCLKDGIQKNHIEYMEPDYTNRVHEYGYDTPREAYAALIDEIKGHGTWESNPYVWVYSFKLIN